MRVSITSDRTIQAVFNKTGHVVFFRSSDNPSKSYMLLDGVISQCSQSLEQLVQEHTDRVPIYKNEEIKIIF